MYYFDNKTLAQYIDQNIDLEVYVDEEWFKLADLSDVSDPKFGVGYDLYGDDHRFDYREIEQVRAGTNVITLDALQTRKGSAPQEEPKKPSNAPPDDTEPAMDKEPPAEEPEEKPKKEPDLSWFSPVYDVGRQLMWENKRKKGKK